MPTIARCGAYRVFFYSNNGVEPPHVHFQRERCLAKFWLDPVALASNSGFRARELRELEALTLENRQGWLEEWDEFFGG
ncbi:MAG: DUF4160 domain-containing protein [Acidobacteriales bacterium]|nr:DUF4160 domain-containing protein [Terriglobales bacterium]